VVRKVRLCNAQPKPILIDTTFNQTGSDKSSFVDTVFKVNMAVSILSFRISDLSS